MPKNKDSYEPAANSEEQLAATYLALNDDRAKQGTPPITWAMFIAAREQALKNPGATVTFSEPDPLDVPLGRVYNWPSYTDFAKDPNTISRHYGEMTDMARRGEIHINWARTFHGYGIFSGEEVRNWEKVNLFNTVKQSFDEELLAKLNAGKTTINAARKAMGLREWTDEELSVLDKLPVTYGDVLTTPVETVVHPSHYNTGKIEVKDFIRDQELNFNVGSTIKYLCRAGKKDPAKHLEDLRKGRQFLDFEIEYIEGLQK